MTRAPWSTSPSPRGRPQPASPARPAAPAALGRRCGAAVVCAGLVLVGVVRAGRAARAAARAVRPDRADPRRQPRSGPSAAHWLGTDEVNRDVLSRTLYGIRIDLLVVFVAVPIGAVIGVAGRAALELSPRSPTSSPSGSSTWCWPSRRSSSASRWPPSIGPGLRTVGRRGHRGRRDPGLRPADPQRGAARSARCPTSRRPRVIGAGRSGCCAGTCCPTRWSRSIVQLGDLDVGRGLRRGRDELPRHRRPAARSRRWAR